MILSAAQTHPSDTITGYTMGFGQTIEADREYIRCQRCECNMLSAIHNQSVVDLICKQDQVEFSCKINDLFQNLLWI